LENSILSKRERESKAFVSHLGEGKIGEPLITEKRQPPIMQIDLKEKNNKRSRGVLD